VASYQCEQGRELYPRNSSTKHCGADYNWNPTDDPICRRVNCPFPQNITNGYYDIKRPTSELLTGRYESTELFLYEDVVAYKCNAGFKFIGHNRTVKSYSITCSVTKLWDRLPPTCEPVSCGSPPRRHHGRLMPSFANKKFAFPDAVTYICDNGYESNDTLPMETLSCTENGWVSFILSS